MKTIILPTDFSRNAKNAVNWALSFFKDADANFVILNTYKAPKTNTGSLVSFNDILHKQSLKDLANYKEEVIDNHPDMIDRIHTVARFGDVLEAVNAATETAGDYSVVVGAKGMSAVKELLVGSNTSDLILNLKQALYVIPENYQQVDFKKIALAIDIKDDINLAVFKPLKNSLERTAASLFPFYFSADEKLDESKKEAAEKLLQEYFNAPQIKLSLLSGENPSERIKTHLKENDLDCLVTVNKKKSFFQRFFHKSFSKELAGNAETVLLILHD